MYHLDAPGVVDCDVVNSDYPSDSGNSTSNYNEDYNEYYLNILNYFNEFLKINYYLQHFKFLNLSIFW